jgi:4-hydroxy 2-oxovalerate aldolase
MSGVRITDVTLRDGSHAMAHRFTVEHVRDTVAALDAAGVPVIEVAHGDGLAGSSFNFGFMASDELGLIRTAVETAQQSRISVLVLPGVGTADDLRAAADAGASVVRVATHCTEADVSLQHLRTARSLDVETVGFLMLSHSVAPERLAEQATIMAGGGAQTVYVVDSAGAMLPADAAARVAAVRAAIDDEITVGFHGHQNLSLGIANSLAAHEAGAEHIDGATRALGAGAGNAPTEILVAAFERLGVDTGVDLAAALAAAEEVVQPYITRQPVMDRGSILLGYAGVYSSFLLHAEAAAERYDVPLQDVLVEVGRRGYVGGQEDMIIDVAVGLAAAAKATA